MPIKFDPLLYPTAGRLQFLAGSTQGHTGYPLPIGFPEKLKPEKGEPPFHARSKATESQDASLVRGHLQSELGQSTGQGLIEPISVTLVTKGTNPIVSVAAR